MQETPSENPTSSEGTSGVRIRRLPAKPHPPPTVGLPPPLCGSPPPRARVEDPPKRGALEGSWTPPPRTGGLGAEEGGHSGTHRRPWTPTVDAQGRRVYDRVNRRDRSTCSSRSEVQQIAARRALARCTGAAGEAPEPYMSLQEGSPEPIQAKKRAWKEAGHHGESSEEEKNSSKTTDLLATPRASSFNKPTCRASPKFLKMMIEHVISSPGKFQGTLAQELKSKDGLDRVLGMVSKNKKQKSLAIKGEEGGAEEVLEQLTRSVLEQRDSHVRKTKKPASDTELERLRQEDPKRYQRILLNREAAARSKAKKKEEEERMKAQILHMKEEQARLREQIDSLRTVFVQLKGEIDLRKAKQNEYEFIDSL